MRRLALLAALALVPACAPLTEDQRAGLDQEICRDILWAYQQDPADRLRKYLARFGLDFEAARTAT